MSGDTDRPQLRADEESIQLLQAIVNGKIRGARRIRKILRDVRPEYERLEAAADCILELAVRAEKMIRKRRKKK